METVSLFVYFFPDEWQKQKQTEEKDLQNKEAIPATMHLPQGHKFMMSIMTQNPTTLSLFCLSNRFPDKKQQPCLPR